MDGEDARSFAAAGWQSVSETINGATAQLAALGPAFENDFASGQPMRKLESVLRQNLADIDWHWPWFENWNCRFDEVGQWPDMWPELVPDDDLEEYSTVELAAFRRSAIAPLIAHTAMMIADRERNRSTPTVCKGWGWRLVSVDAVEAAVAEQYRSAISLGDLSKLPPFFPGDRTCLQLGPPDRG